MKNYRKWFLFSMFVGGFFLVDWLWPDSEKLPILEYVNGFQLDNVHGDTYHSQNNKVKLVTFFFTNCPEICPMTMLDFKELQTQLKKKEIFGDKVELVAVSLDPENDLPPVILNYAAAFQADPVGWKWLRGSPEEIKELANELQMQYEIENGEVLYHSITMYLLDENNYIRGIYDMALSDRPVDKNRILEDIEILVY